MSASPLGCRPADAEAAGGELCPPLADLPTVRTTDAWRELPTPEGSLRVGWGLRESIAGPLRAAHWTLVIPGRTAPALEMGRPQLLAAVTTLKSARASGRPELGLRFAASDGLTLRLSAACPEEVGPKECARGSRRLTLQGPGAPDEPLSVMLSAAQLGLLEGFAARDAEALTEVARAEQALLIQAHAMARWSVRDPQFAADGVLATPLLLPHAVAEQLGVLGRALTFWAVSFEGAVLSRQPQHWLMREEDGEFTWHPLPQTHPVPPMRRPVPRGPQSMAELSGRVRELRRLLGREDYRMAAEVRASLWALVRGQA